MLAVGGLNGTVRIWDLAGTALATFELASPTLVLDWQPGEPGPLAAGLDGTIHSLDIEAARQAAVAHDHTSEVTSLARGTDRTYSDMQTLPM